MKRKDLKRKDLNVGDRVRHKPSSMPFIVHRIRKEDGNVVVRLRYLYSRTSFWDISEDETLELFTKEDRR